ncbi:MAG TPA: cytochrome b5 domain-containing protein [Anaerolineae bacterium]|nr:cytochrome b5 domain-containing protein [Anaerolineae bacterium]
MNFPSSEFSPPPTESLREISIQELRRCDGSRKNPVYIAYKGLVYDVSTSSFWRTGLHRDLHFAGQDLTDEIADAPHTDLVFHKFPIVGRLKT